MHLPLVTSIDQRAKVMKCKKLIKFLCVKSHKEQEKKENAEQEHL